MLYASKIGSGRGGTMDLGLTESQRMLKTSAREFLEKECPLTFVREMEVHKTGYTPELWKKMTEMGWLGLAFPEQYGGSGGSFSDLSVLLEEMGRALLPGPFFSDIVLGGLTVLDAGTESQKQAILSRVVSGETVLTLAVTEPSGRWDAQGIHEVKATNAPAGWTLNGTKLFVQNANTATTFLVAARTQEGSRSEQGITLFIVPAQAAGISQTSLTTMASDHQSEVTFKNVVVPASAVLGRAGEGWPIVKRAFQRAAAAKCVEMIGGAEKVLEMTTDYAKQRVQFGRPIGTFQAIQHHCANMAVEVESSKYIAYKAVWSIDQEEDASQAISAAKAWVSESYRKTCALAHQSHGAIGFTKEHNLQLYTRRAKVGEILYGEPAYHREQVAMSLAL
ncbi:MAG: acyl-CoA dehydrogenase [Dehalococcoidia bacterium]|nr:acyl-CoA dehydrogenase [Dehalococcoidia bacterium]